MSTGRWTRGLTRLAVLLWGAWGVNMGLRLYIQRDDITADNWAAVAAFYVVLGLIVPGLFVLGIRWTASAFEGKDDKP